MDYMYLQVCPHNPANKSWHIDKLARAMQEGDGKKPNPVVQRVKIIMALGLVVVHIHSRFLSQVTGVSFSLSTSSSLMDSEGMDREMEHVPLHDYLWWKALHLSVDQLVTTGLGVLLLIKYMFYDKTDIKSSSKTYERKASSSANIPSIIDGDITTAYFRKRSISVAPVPLASKEGNIDAIRKDSGIEECSYNEKDCPVSVAVQTDELHTKFFISDSPDIDSNVHVVDLPTEECVPTCTSSRSVSESLEILKSEVSGYH